MTDSSEKPARRRRFGEFVFDSDSQQLLRSDREVALSPKAFRVLELLARQPGEVVTKDRLLDEIWADVHVLEGVVKVCIAEIRRALGETAARPRHLHTVQRRGYRFEIGDTVEVGADPSATAAPGIARVDLAPREVPEATGPIQLTVLACEGLATAAAGSSESDESRASLRRTCIAIARSLGGRVVAHADDPLVAYFGHPRGTEDDALQAVRASLRMLERVEAMEVGSRAASAIDLRIGIHTGSAVPDPKDPSGTPELGDTVRIATRIASQVPGVGLRVSDTTRRRVRDAFVLEEVDASGPDSTPVFRVREARDGTSANPSGDAIGRSPIVGRQQEIALLLDRWERVKEGHGQAVLVSGEAGIGKTRLVEALRERLADEPHGWIELRGSAYHRNSVFRPVIELLHQALQFSAEDEPAEQVARLELGLEQAKLPVDEVLPLFASLLSLPLPLDFPPLQMSSEVQRKRTFEAMCAWILVLAEERPLVITAEDLHWTDPSTVELLGMLIEQGQWTQTLILATHRAEFVPPWPNAQAVVLPLHPLSRKEVDALVASVAGGKRVPLSVREHVFAKGDGVPLFVEELAKSVLESDLLVESDDSWERTDPLPGMAVPSTLQDSLEAQLDRLDSARELSQLAATLGREFSHVELLTAAGASGQELDRPLQELMEAGLLYRRGMPPRATYSFKHALIQETAYGSLPRPTRERYHARIAQAFEERFPERWDTEPEEIARHYEGAGLTARAISAYQRAGAQAAARSAPNESIAHYEKALELLALTPAGSERDECETELQLAVGAPLAALRGFGSASVEEVYERARCLSEDRTSSPQLADALDGLVACFVTQSRLREASDLTDQQLRISEHLNQPDRLLGSHYCLALIHYFEGNSPQALDHFEKFDAIYDPEEHRDLIAIRGENVGVASAIWQAWALWIRGYPDQAVSACHEALKRANRAAHPFDLAYAHAWTSVVFWNRRDRGRGLEHAELAIVIAEEHGFPIPLGVARLAALGCRPASAESAAEVPKRAEEILIDLAGTGTKAGVPQILGGLAEFCLERGHPEQAAGYVDAAFAVSQSTGQPHWDAELARTRAGLLLVQQPDSVAEVEAAYREAIDIASKQDARSLQLRAANSLGQLLRDLGRPAEAVEVVGEIHGQFSEGFETEDLKTARALLDELE